MKVISESNGPLQRIDGLCLMILLGALLPVGSARAQNSLPSQDLRPAWIIELPQTVADVFVADAGGATMHRFVNEGQGVRWRKAFYMSIGKNGTRKERDRDKKTPIGTYFITEELDTLPMHARYGTAAFPLDYPNTWDQLHDRTGYGIWLHGVDRRDPHRPPLDTDGCLALPNQAIQEISAALQPLNTPIVVAGEMRWVSVTELEQTRRAMHGAIESWRSSIADGDLGEYLSLYSDDFRHNGMDKAQWAEYRLQVIDEVGLAEVSLSNLYLLADPAEPGLYLSRFTQTTKTASETVSFTKRIYWRRLPNDRWKIVAEGTG